MRIKNAAKCISDHLLREILVRAKKEKVFWLSIPKAQQESKDNSHPPCSSWILQTQKDSSSNSGISTNLEKRGKRFFGKEEGNNEREKKGRTLLR